MKKIILSCAVALLVSVAVFGQRAPEPKRENEKARTQTNTATAAPSSVDAQYQGGLFGYNKKLKGTLVFDDVNQRMFFRNNENKEVFGIPYKSLLVVYGDSASYRPTGATVASAIPAPYGANIPFAFIRAKKRFLIVQFDDPDSQVQGTTSFRIANKDLLQQTVQSLGQKAEMKQRGDAYYRPRTNDKPAI